MDHKREDRTPPLARVMGVGRQQQHETVTLDELHEIMEKEVGSGEVYYKRSIQHTTATKSQSHHQNSSHLSSRCTPMSSN